MKWVAAGVLGLLLGLGVSCGSDPIETTPSETTGAGAGGAGGAGGEPVCGTANRPLDETALLELGYDTDGATLTHLREQNLSVSTSPTTQFVLNDVPLHEAVRFELAHPARIHGFKVKWANVPDADPKAEIEAGLYGDFGYNGFDFWEPDPLWAGTRCVEDIDDSGAGWTVYAFDAPVVVDHPGLVYVAHRAEPATAGGPTLPTEAVWWLDDVVEGDPMNPCATFDQCQSAFNLPQAETQQFYNGLSFPFQNHFVVRLFVEYTDSVQPTDTFFQPVPMSPTSGHVAWADYDNDGYDDLLLGAQLWRNNGDGTFSDVSQAAGLAGVAATSGAWGDYDNDGCLDLFAFVEAYNVGDTLLRNQCDGTFVVANSGIVDQQSYENCGNASNTASPTASASWVDIDADGYLDLYLAEFICWDKGTSYYDTVWHNNGDGTFQPLGTQNGFPQTKRATRTVAAVDHDNDGDVDIAVGNYRLEANQFFSNQGNGNVVENAMSLGLAGVQTGLYFGHTIGLAWGDLDNDGDFDQIAANLAHPRFFDFSSKTEVLMNDGTGHYTNASGDWATPRSAVGLRYQETHSVPALFDADNDGALDLAITCVYDGRPTDFYWGNGDGTFLLDAYHAGITTENGWGVAVADYDHDGDVDLFAERLFENTLAAAAKGHWLEARVIGTLANRAGIGATVAVTTGAITRIRHVQGATGKGGQDSLHLSFGLGMATMVDSIEVRFPGGASVTYAGPIATDQRVWLYQNQTTALPGWTAPNGY